MNRKKKITAHYYKGAAKTSRLDLDWCRKCGGSGIFNSAKCKLCKGDGQIRTTLCLRCDRKMAMNHEYDKICSSCKSRNVPTYKTYKVIFG